MEIRKADSKGRLTVGDDGQIYSVTRHEDGTLTLRPVKIPEPPKMDNHSLRALYWDPAARASHGDHVFIHSVLPYGDVTKNADYIAEIANFLKIPVVVKAVGLGRAAADYLAQDKRVLRDVILTY